MHSPSVTQLTSEKNPTQTIKQKVMKSKINLKKEKKQKQQQKQKNKNKLQLLLPWELWFKATPSFTFDFQLIHH